MPGGALNDEKRPGSGARPPRGSQVNPEEELA